MARKRKQPERFDLKLDAALAKALRERAAAEDRTVTAIVERALRLYFEKGPA